MTYLLCHGLGFTNDYWKNLIPLMSNAYNGAKFAFFDEHFCLVPNEDYIGIGHSIGFLKLNNYKMNHSLVKLKALIGLQGFLNFCGTLQPYRSERLKTIDKMISICSKDYQKFLIFFHKVCGYSTEADEVFPYLEISKEKLIEDLKLMKNAYKHCGIPTLIIGSFEDSIVGPYILRDNFVNRTKPTTEKVDNFLPIHLRFVKGINHTLGYSKSGEVFKIIRQFLKTLLGHKKNDRKGVD